MKLPYFRKKAGVVKGGVVEFNAPLTTEEWKLLREHSVIGSRIIAGIPSLERIAQIVRYHHERFDGQGYPDKIAGEQIPLASRIIAIADAFQAITSDRPYRQGRTKDQAMAELVRCSGSQFDPYLVDFFCKNCLDD